MKLTTVAEQSPKGAFFKAALQELKQSGIKQIDPKRVAEKNGMDEMYQDAEDLLKDLVKLGFDELAARIRNATPQSHSSRNGSTKLVKPIWTWLTAIHRCYSSCSITRLTFHPRRQKS